MSISLKEATEFMLTEGYILALGKGKYKLSTKFHQDVRFALQMPGIMVQLPRGVYESPGPPVHFTFSWEEDYKRFIIEAKVPRRLDARDGSYTANAYSVDGMKAFRKAIESGVILEMLTKSTMLYYHSTIKYKQAIGRYMHEGTWKTGYDELLAKANEGEQQVIDHIKQETTDEQQSSYRLG